MCIGVVVITPHVFFFFLLWVWAFNAGSTQYHTNNISFFFSKSTLNIYENVDNKLITLYTLAGE